MNREFIEYLSERKNETLAVATILYTCGSTPRKAGTSMVVFPDGSIFGTIGGGRAENEIRLSAVDSLNKKEAHRRIDVHLDDDVAVKEGMVCGAKWMFGLKHKTSNKNLIQRLFINLQYSQNELKYKVQSKN